MLKKTSLFTLMALFVMMAFVFSACGAASTTPGDSTTAGSTAAAGDSTTAATTAATEDNSSKMLKVGMEVGYPPMEMVSDKDGKTVEGFDVDVANELAKRLGYGGIEIVNTAWDGIFTALDTNKFDCIISSVSITDERQAAYALTKAYVANKQVLVIKPSDTSITSPEQLVGKKLGLQQGTTAEDYIKGQIDGGLKAEYTPYQKVTQPFTDLKIGRLNAVLVDVVVAGYYVVQDKESYKIAWQSPDKEPMAIAFAKTNADLRDKANKALDDMQADGTMEKISVKWFSQDITKDAAQ